MDILKSIFIAMIATLFCIWLLHPLAHRIGFVDRPGGRKHHEHNTPLIGGIAMFFGFCFSLLALEQSLQSYRGLIAGSSLLILLGIVDDFKELRPKLRLLGQIGAALCLIFWGSMQINQLGNLFFLGNMYLGIWSLPITVFCILGFINAMNMLDGQDGLAGGVAFTQTLLLLIIALQQHFNKDAHVLLLISILLSVFLYFNMRMPWRKKASIFMGDSGVTFIAFLIAWFAIELSQINTKAIAPITILWILAFPLFDLIAVCIHRIRRKKPVLCASRDHFHHILHLIGINVQISTFLLCTFSFVLGAVGLLMNNLNVPEFWQLILFFVVLVAYLTLVKYVRDPIYKVSLHKSSS